MSTAHPTDHHGAMVLDQGVSVSGERARTSNSVAIRHGLSGHSEKNAGGAPHQITAGVLQSVESLLDQLHRSTRLVSEAVRKSGGTTLTEVIATMRDSTTELGRFLAQDLKGRQVTAFLEHVAAHLNREQGQLHHGLQQLSKTIENLQALIATQATFAQNRQAEQPLNVAELIEDSLRLNARFIDHGKVKVVRDYAQVPPIVANRKSILQILVKLIQNAKNAFEQSGKSEHQLTVCVRNGDGRIKISIGDNGIGIPSQNLSHLFSCGFTTRKEGQGFGLHRAAQAAIGLGGLLHAQSEGVGRGATFTLELPATVPNDPPPTRTKLSLRRGSFSG